MNFEEALNKLNNESKQALSKATSLDEMLKIFANNGLDVSEEDIKSVANKSGTELSDDDLENVTGGLDPTFVIQMTLKFLSDRLKDNLKDKNK